jgi:hypothetical protein
VLGEKFGCTRQAISNHVRKAVRRLRHPGWEELTDPDILPNPDGFYVAVHFVDFTPLRGELVRLRGIHVNAPGETPFDPVSLFVCCLLRWETGKGWPKLAKFLAGPEGTCWRRLCGFRVGDTPAASTMRHFFHALGTAFDRDLCPRFIELLRTAELLSPHDAKSATPARDGLPLAADGMLHDAHEQTTCSQVRATCYQLTTPDQRRPCPAQDVGQRGCDCDTQACRENCRRATPRDPEARFIHYTGRNQEGDEDPRRARNVHGYPMAFNGLDYDRLRATWVCHQVCRRAAQAPPEDADCPYRDPDRPLGMSRHVTDTFLHPDGSHHARLARLFAYDSSTWQDRYDSRRNATEGRNSQLENLQLKQIRSYGLHGAIADITFADLLINLRTLGRLVRQASLLSN